MTKPVNVIRCDQFVPRPPAEVWRALTQPDLLARWWAPGAIRPVVGHRFTLDMGPWGQQPCEVIAVEPGRLLAYTFADGTLDTTITWRVEPEGTGTRLFLEHKGFDMDSPAGRQAHEGMGAGWPTVLARIDGALDVPAGSQP
ncbi:MAG TPA: SRPBCC domain-containing protein [Acidimicrobiales bacterium]|nr:SRPBCC domain-containing protein [Acidimicrobiales bacterium]